MPFTKKIIWCSLLFFFSIKPILAQQATTEFETIFAQIAETLENPEVAETLLEDLFFIYENPLNLNTVSSEELELFPFLNNEQIQNFLNFRNNYSTIYSVFELQLIPKFDEKSIALLLPFVYVESDTWNFKKLSKRILQGNTSVLNRISYNYNSEEIKDVELKYYTKIQYNYKQNVFAGFTGETDAGEKPKFAYDHTGFYFMLKNYKQIRNLNIGDFSVR
ncbi:MAG TPA: hypothetical protein DCQ31_06590, partial [Bacteroidales bacterium]|nr:hypothetical protein [Bacteroidales bacterium]